jgi:hypothetical protein
MTHNSDPPASAPPPKAPSPSAAPPSEVGAPTLPMASPPEGAIDVFISSCPTDRDLSAEFERHLVLLKRQGLIKVSSGRSVGYTRDVRAQIEHELRSAKIILILVSAEYLGWEHCDEELALARQCDEAGTATVLSILMKPLELQDACSDKAGKAWFAGLVRLPRNGIAVARWESKDKALAEIAGDLKKLLTFPLRPGP